MAAGQLCTTSGTLKTLCPPVFLVQIYCAVLPGRTWAWQQDSWMRPAALHSFVTALCS
jgi:hypothetical protein